MKIKYTKEELERARGDVIDIYRIAEERVCGGCIGAPRCWRGEIRNVWQVFRYAFREWALGRDRGVVLRALMLSDSPVREVSSNLGELEIRCDDPEVAKAIEEILRRDGYAED